MNHDRGGVGGRNPIRVGRGEGPSTKMTQADDDEVDFTGGRRSRFYRKEAALIAPIHLEPEVQAFLQARAERRGMALSAFVNLILKKEIELIEAAG